MSDSTSKQLQHKSSINNPVNSSADTMQQYTTHLMNKINKVQEMEDSKFRRVQSTSDPLILNNEMMDIGKIKKLSLNDTEIQKNILDRSSVENKLLDVESDTANSSHLLGGLESIIQRHERLEKDFKQLLNRREAGNTSQEKLS